MRLEAVGYWFNELAPSAYPRPQALVGRWSSRRRAAVAAYLRSGVMFESYRASSFCRFACGVTSRAMGHRDLTDGVFVWPEGLAHYVAAHAVRLPERFVRRAIARRRADALRPTQREGMIDDTSWLAWGRARGASLDLAGWELPSQRQQRELGKRIAPEYRALMIVLRRASPLAAVCILPSRELLIVELGRRVRTRVLPGWDAWPADGGTLPT